MLINHTFHCLYCPAPVRVNAEVRGRDNRVEVDCDKGHRNVFEFYSTDAPCAQTPDTK